jgi:hypothetical protein
MVLTRLSNHLTSNNHRINNRHNSAIQVAIPKCSKRCNIQACKEWVKAMPRKAEGSINPIKALNNSCSPILPDLSLVLRAGQGSRRRDLEASGEAGLDSLNDSSHENIPIITSYEVDGMMSTYIHDKNVLRVASR